MVCLLAPVNVKDVNRVMAPSPWAGLTAQIAPEYLSAFSDAASVIARANRHVYVLAVSAEYPALLTGSNICWNALR